MRILALERWLDHKPPSSSDISVVVPRRDRPPLLLRDRIDSVRAQSHAAWQLLVIHGGDP